MMQYEAPVRKIAPRATWMITISSKNIYSGKSRPSSASRGRSSTDVSTVASRREAPLVVVVVGPRPQAKRKAGKARAGAAAAPHSRHTYVDNDADRPWPMGCCRAAATLAGDAYMITSIIPPRPRARPSSDVGVGRVQMCRFRVGKRSASSSSLDASQNPPHSCRRRSRRAPGMLLRAVTLHPSPPLSHPGTQKRRDRPYHSRRACRLESRPDKARQDIYAPCPESSGGGCSAARACAAQSKGEESQLRRGTAGKAQRAAWQVRREVHKWHRAQKVRSK
ncbi:hypothetical protein K438DRAFT_732482 [Mycena galopus ATCC 62051]|nr:hypothetical protein K438DRAFT_732482 [Mycena galopus ATCC 62051]